jgi:polysaccharide export outer membrane protein
MNAMTRVSVRSVVLAISVCVLASGCHAFGVRKETLKPLPPVPAPRELNKVVLPDYIIEPPDVLLIDAVNVVPRGPLRVSPLDVLMVQASPTFQDNPINGPMLVDASGSLNLGAAYGSVPVAGLSIDQATGAIQKHLSRVLEKPTVTVSLLQSAAKQQIAGEHLVGPDGTVNLGTYGRVFVTGATVDQARRAIEAHLAQFLDRPQISLDIAGYNSKSYYIITEGAGFGDGVNRFPVTGNETVLDAISHINGLSQVSSKKIWIARPAPGEIGCDQVLPVDWVAITKGGSTVTNYQIMPGDRIFIAEDHLVATDTALGKLLAPIERLLGVTLLGSQTVESVNRLPGGAQF